MKRLKNTFFVTALTVFALLSFTSCEEETYWNRGELNFFTSDFFDYQLYTDDWGEFGFPVTFYDLDILGYDARYDILDDYIINNIRLTVYNKSSFKPGYEIDVYLECKGVGTYSNTLFVDHYGLATIDGSRDPELMRFMNRFIDRLLSGGQATLHISGGVYDKYGYPVERILPYHVDLNSSIDLLISSRHR